MGYNTKSTFDADAHYEAMSTDRLIELRDQFTKFIAEHQEHMTINHRVHDALALIQIKIASRIGKKKK